MTRLSLTVALALALAGCGPQTTPRGADGGDAKQPAPVEVKPEDKLPTTLNYLYKGQNAEFWGRRLYEQDRWLIGETEAGMFFVKDEGLRFSLKALRDKDSNVRILSARSLSYTACDYEDLFYPLLLAMFSNPSESEWVSAAQAMENSRYTKGVTTIRAAADKASDVETKRQLRNYADALEKKK